jgi:transcription factor E
MAKKLKIKISDVRATLNKLHSLGVVDYTRHKDSETGWFSYYWFLNVEKMKGWVAKKIDDDHRRMDFSRGEHYYCPGCGGASIHDFVSASDFGFKCPTCSGSLDYLSEDKANELFPMRSMRKPLL